LVFVTKYRYRVLDGDAIERLRAIFSKVCVDFEAERAPACELPAKAFDIRFGEQPGFPAECFDCDAQTWYAVIGKGCCGHRRTLLPVAAGHLAVF
jgi:hypothetical protein